MKKIVSLICVVLTTQVTFSQTINKAKLDSFFNALEVNDKFMGSVAVAQNGQLLYTKAIGYADIATKQKANVNTKYRIGSVSKTFTTVLVFKAIEDHKIALNQTLDKYFPEVKNSSKITIAMLLTHRSGIHNFTDDDNYTSWNTQKKSEKEMMEIIVKGGSDFEPDSKSDYSNSNFVVLSFILQKIYNKDYATLLKEKIVTPLKLPNTYFGNGINIAKNESNSYAYLGGWEKQTITDMSIPMGAGGIVSTPTDLTTFAYALFTGKLVSTESLKQMETIKDDLGMGLFQIPFYEKKGYGHTGGIDGFTSVFAFFPDDNTAFALTSNGTNFENNNISIALLSSVYNKPYEIPTFKTYDVSTEALDVYLGVYSSKEIALKITFTKKGNTLLAQATNQPQFALEATDKDKFKFEQAGAVIEFEPTTKQMFLKQGGATFNFTKD